MRTSFLLPFPFLIAACSSSTTGTTASNNTIEPAVVYPPCSSAAPAQCLDGMPVGQGFTMPFYRSFSLTTPNPDIRTAIVVVHGVDRDASNFFHSVMTAASQIGVDASTLVVAPHFQCSADDPPPNQVYWQCDGQDWAHGYGDASGAASPIYSYAVMDQFLSTIAGDQGQAPTFPNLTRIVVTGLSAGGQFTQRYAATTNIAFGAPIALEYAVLAPSSYLYLDANRLASGATCSETGGCTGTFAPLAPDADCSDYDNYHYGLEDRSGYVGQPSDDRIRTQYLARDVRYFVGSDDTLANAAGTDLDTSCEANAQGIDRVARAINFWNAMRSEYGATHPLTVVPGCTHSRPCMYFSPQVRQALFEDAVVDAGVEGG